MSERIEFIEATSFAPIIWTAEDIREQWPEDSGDVTDDTFGVLVATSDGDGALLVGTVEQLYDKLQWALGRVIQQAKPDSPIFQ